MEPDPNSQPQNAPMPAASPQPPTNTMPPQPTVVAAPAAPVPSQAPAGDLPPVPGTWPGGFGLYKYSKAAVKVNVWPLIIIYVAIAVVTLLLETRLKSAGQIIGSLLGILGSTAYTLLWLAGIRREKMSAGEALSQGIQFFLNLLIATILVGLISFISLLLLIIPFFFVAPRLALVNYFVIDKKLGPIAAIKASWAITKGNIGKVYSVALASIAMSLLFLTIIGIPFAIYFLLMYSASLAVLYEFLQAASGHEAPAPAPVPPVQPPSTPYMAAPTA
jgi:hypothetical protein